jgi:hypothetical protein
MVLEKCFKGSANNEISEDVSTEIKSNATVASEAELATADTIVDGRTIKYSMCTCAAILMNYAVIQGPWDSTLTCWLFKERMGVQIIEPSFRPITSW